MNAIITAYFTGWVDPQRGHKWTASENDIYPLSRSCEMRGYKLIVLNDCFKSGERNGIEFVSAVSSLNPYFQRWLAYGEYLNGRKDIESAFVVDATDVIMQHDPFYAMDSKKIYVGDEFDVLGSQWIRNDTGSLRVNKFIDKNPDLLLLNAGVLGASRENLIEISKEILLTEKQARSKSRTDMAVFNYVLRTLFNDRLVRGRNVTSIFKKYEQDSGAWFTHK